MSKLLRKPAATNPIHSVTPQNAGWTHVGFEVRDLKPGEACQGVVEQGREACLVLVAGRGRLAVDGVDLGEVGGRANPFDGDPWSLYAPPGAAWRLLASTPVELAICTAPAKGGKPARLIPPSEVGQETRGVGTNVRHVRNILPDSSPHAENLLVVEVITPPGHWSSYPPHKHDQDALPDESQLEETYYHRLDPPQGFGFQRVYTDDRSLDEAVAFSNRDVVLVPRGYHPVGAPHGYRLYYLNVMAGPTKIWRFRNDPDHAWLMGR
jgi:5-deoxy-glucuronate isomerase